VTARDLLAAGIALRELEDERDLLGAAFLESVVPRPGAAEALKLPEGLLVDGAPLHGIESLDGASFRAKVPDKCHRQGQDEEQGEGPPGAVAVTAKLHQSGSGRSVHAARKSSRRATASFRESMDLRRRPRKVIAHCKEPHGRGLQRAIPSRSERAGRGPARRGRSISSAPCRDPASAQAPAAPGWREACAYALGVQAYVYGHPSDAPDAPHWSGAGRANLASSPGEAVPPALLEPGGSYRSLATHPTADGQRDPTSMMARQSVISTT
jgi:hypothetical protein